MRTGDWDEMRAEAEIIVELLKVIHVTDPRVLDLLERAQDLQRLGWEAREVAAATVEGRRH